MTIDKYSALLGYDSVEDFLTEHGEEPALLSWDYSFGEMYQDGEWVEEGFEDAYVDTGLTLNYLVKEDLYEACKQTSEDSELVTSSYGTSLGLPPAMAPTN